MIAIALLLLADVPFAGDFSEYGVRFDPTDPKAPNVNDEWRPIKDWVSAGVSARAAVNRRFSAFALEQIVTNEARNKLTDAEKKEIRTGALTMLAKETDEQAALYVASLVKLLANDSCRQPLFQAISKNRESTSFRQRCLDALRGIATDADIPVLLGLVSDESVARDAIAVLGTIKTLKSKQALDKLAAKKPPPEIAEAIAQALDELEKP